MGQTHSYDALNRVASFVSTESRVYTFSYDADSRRTTVNYGSGDRLTAYDALNRVVTQVEQVGGSPILTIVDAYDSAGRKISQLRDADLTSNTYDSADRLTGQQVTGAFATFTMDAVGNITVKSQQGSSPITMTYNAGSRLVTSVEGAVVSTYTFDANGNQTAVNAGGSRTTYAYDYENRMRTVVEPGNVRTTMAYYAEGLRRTKTTSGGSTTYVWDGSNYLQARSGPDLQTFSVVNSQMLSQEAGGTEGIFVPDSLGSLVNLLDSSGNELYEAFYWPYGEVISSTGVNNSILDYVGTYGYIWDSTRRVYVRAREYDPVMARWLTIDQLWPKESAYIYVRLDPMRSIDPSGKLNDIPKQPKPCKIPPYKPEDWWENPFKKRKPKYPPGLPIITSSPDCGPSVFTCLAKQMPPSLGGFNGLPNTGACNACCAKIPSYPPCRVDRDLCFNSCFYGHFGGWQAGINQIF